MDRLVVLRLARQLRPLLVRPSSSSATARSISNASSSAFIALDHGSAEQFNVTNDDSAAKLWSALEETEIPRPKSTASKEDPSNKLAAQSVTPTLSSAKTVEELDAKWQEMIQAGMEKPSVETLLERSLALSRLSRSRKDSVSVFDAFTQLEHVAGPEITNKSLEATAEALLRCGMNVKAAEMIKDYRSKHGNSLLSRRAYAILVAASLEGPRGSTPLVGEKNENVRIPMDASSESAFRTALRYFKGLLGGDDAASETKGSTLEQIPAPGQRVGVFQALDILREDNLKGNQNALLSQELFEEVLLLSPAKAPQISDAMRAAGFTPTKTSFLASLYGAMKQADASRAVNLLGEMHSMNVERTEMHYIATAAALKRRTQLITLDEKSVIKPWYYRAVLDEYIKDFGDSISIEFASAIVTGMCASRSPDQEIIPEMQLVLEVLKGKRAAVDGEALGVLISRLAVTKGELNLLRICEWMRETSMKRDRYVNNGFLHFYAESLLKATKAVDKFSKDNDAVRLKEAQYKQQGLLVKAESLASEMLSQGPEFKATLAFFEGRVGSRASGAAKPPLVDYSEFKLVDDELERADSHTLLELALAYGYSLQTEALRAMIANLRKDKYTDSNLSEMDLILMRALGKSGKVDEAIEIAAEIQSRGDKVTPEMVDAFADHVFIRNDRLADAVGYALGLCRTYGVRPNVDTLLKLRRKALRDENKEEGERIEKFFQEFDYSRELSARKRLEASSLGHKRA